MSVCLINCLSACPYVCQSVYFFVCLFQVNCLSVYLLSFCVLACLSLSPSVCLFICLSIYLTIHSSHLPINFSIYLSIYQSINPCIHPFINPFIRSSNHLLIHPSIHPSIKLADFAPRPTTHAVPTTWSRPRLALPGELSHRTRIAPHAPSLHHHHKTPTVLPSRVRMLQLYTNSVGPTRI